MASVLSTVGLVWYGGLWSIGLLGCWTARNRYRQHKSSAPLIEISNLPGVSVLRPLKGLDSNLYENLESTFKQDYPNFEIIFSVADEHDQALAVVQDLLARYPTVNARIIIGEEIVGVNPKVNNLMRPYRQAVNDILWVIDSNAVVSPGTLKRSVEALLDTTCPKKIGLVHHVPFAICTEPCLGSRIEQTFLNTNHAKMYLAINTVAIESCVVGKSNLYRRSDIERVNGSLTPTLDASSTYGLPAFGKFLAEDNMIGAALWKELGQRHDLAQDVVSTVVGNMSVADYIDRRVRWIRVRKRMVLAATLLEPLTECILVSLIGAASISHLFNISPWITLLIHYVAWIQVDLDVYGSLAGKPLALDRQFMGAWIAREMLALPIWIAGVFGNDVVWRGNRYRMLPGGLVEELTDNPPKGWFRFGSRNNYEPVSAED